MFILKVNKNTLNLFFMFMIAAVFHFTTNENLYLSKSSNINIRVNYLFFQISKTTFKESLCLYNINYNKNKNLWRRKWKLVQSKPKFCYLVLLITLLLSGDVEQNPGPTILETKTDDQPPAKDTKTYCFKIVKVEPDGNCLFRSLSKHLFNSEKFHEKLRNEAVQFINKEWEEMKYHVMEEVGGSLSRKDYCDEMKRDKTYATSVECFPISEIYNVQIKIYIQSASIRKSNRYISFDTQPTIISKKDHSQSIYLLISGNLSSGHFDLLVPNDNGPKHLRINALNATILKNLHNDTLIKTTKKSINILPTEECTVRNVLPVSSKCDHCGKYFENTRGLKIHISKSHLDIHREQIKNKYVSEPKYDNSSLKTDSSLLNKDVSILLDNKIEHQLNEWYTIFSTEMNIEDFSCKVTEFSQFLAEIIHELPGPKHPARRFYELRKKKKQLVSQNRSYKDSSNPIRKTKNDRKKRKEKYDYDIIQYEYYNRRRRAVRRIMGNETKPCKISLQELYDHFCNRLGLSNNKMMQKYDKVGEEILSQLNDDYCKQISVDEVSQAVRRVKVDTTPGPDQVLMRAVKIKNVDKVLALMFSTMHSENIVPYCFKQARTILLDKQGNPHDVCNWRPISICSVLRRVFEKILDQRLKKYISLNTIQKGFVNKPGTYINSNILNNILVDAKYKKKDCCIFILDIEKAYDNVGHEHISAVLESLEIPSLLKDSIMNLQLGNSTRIETSLGKTKAIQILRGLLQGAPLSPTMFNLSINHILDEMSEPNVSEQWGYKLDKDLGAVNILSFADDTVLVAKGKREMLVLYDMIVSHFERIGLKINVSKTKIINISKGNLSPETFLLEDYSLTSISCDENVKYLGVNFQNEIVLNKESIMNSLHNKVESIVKTPFLKSNQKFYILNNCIWPILVYPFQCAPLPKLTIGFLNDIDLVFRTAAKEILELPNDFPSSILYSPKCYKGLGIMKAYWEAHIQHINICKLLITINDPYIVNFQNLESEIKDCLTKLKLLEFTNLEEINSKKIRMCLQEKEYESWCALPHKGRGAVLFSECKTINKKINNLEGLSDSEFKDYLKMIGDVAPVRGVHGRSKDGIRCRRCSTSENFVIETLPHVLGQCPYGALLRNQRHHRIRTIIADEFRKNKEVEVYEEVTALADEGSIRRSDIIIVDKKRNSGLILDPTIRFEISSDQPNLTNQEKQNIYNKTLNYYSLKYNIQNFNVLGLFIGSRGTIPKFFSDFWYKYNFKGEQLTLISIICIKSSINILRHHLYSEHNQN